MLICRGIQSQASKYCHQTQTMRYLLSSDGLVRRLRRTYNSKVVAVGACGDLLVGSSDQDLELLSLVKRGWWTAGRSSQLVPQNNNRSAQDSPPTNRSLAAFIFYTSICTVESFLYCLEQSSFLRRALNTPRTLFQKPFKFTEIPHQRKKQVHNLEFSFRRVCGESFHRLLLQFCSSETEQTTYLSSFCTRTKQLLADHGRP